MKYFFYLLFVSGMMHAQKGTFTVRQMQQGSSLDSLVPIQYQGFLTKAEFGSKGIRLWIMGGMQTDAPFSESNRVNTGWNSFHYTVMLHEQMKLRLFINPYPKKNSPPQLTHAILMMSENQDLPLQKTFYQKFVFWDELKMRDENGNLIPEHAAASGVRNGTFRK